MSVTLIVRYFTPTFLSFTANAGVSHLVAEGHSPLDLPPHIPISACYPQVCVVVRNVEHVCDEVRKHLQHLGELAGETQEVAHQLQDRITHLPEHVEDSAEALVRQVSPFTLIRTCYLRLKEKTLTH